MKTETKKKIGIGAVVTGLVATAVAVVKAKAAPPVVCTPGREDCIGPDWCRCNPAGTKWIVVTRNATQCAAPPLTAILYGTVQDRDTGELISDILVDCGGYIDTTGMDGTYRIEEIPPGEYPVIFCDPLGRYETKEI